MIVVLWKILLNFLLVRSELRRNLRTYILSFVSKIPKPQTMFFSFVNQRSLVWFNLSIRTEITQPYLIRACIKSLDEGYQGQFRELKVLLTFSVTFLSILWSIWTYRSKATMTKEPFSATNVVMYCKSLISMCRVTVQKTKEASTAAG